MNVFKLAWRNVWRSRRRSSVTIAAMTFALLAMILLAGMIEGYLNRMEESLVEVEVGDLQVFAGDYRKDPSIYTRIEDPRALLEKLDAAGFRATTRLLAYGLASSDDASAGVSFRGIDVERDRAVSEVYARVADGEWLDASDPKGVVLGRRLARALEATPGSEILVLSQGADGAMAYDLYDVRGVLSGISDATDRTGVFMTQDAFRELMVVPGGVHQLLLRRPEGVEGNQAADTVRAIRGDLDVKTWRELFPTLATLIDSTRGLMFAYFFVVYVAVGILILNAMLMAVFERVREFGVLKALGVGPFEVLRLIVAEAAIQTGIAMALGFALAIPGLWYLIEVGVDLASMADVSLMGLVLDPVWRAAMGPFTIAGPTLTLVVIVALAVLYPACKAALIQPVDAMRYH